LAEYAFLTTWLLDSPREPVWEAIHAQEEWPRWWRGVEEASELRSKGRSSSSGVYDTQLSPPVRAAFRC